MFDHGSGDDVFNKVKLRRMKQAFVMAFRGYLKIKQNELGILPNVDLGKIEIQKYMRSLSNVSLQQIVDSNDSSAVMTPSQR